MFTSQHKLSLYHGAVNPLVVTVLCNVAATAAGRYPAAYLSDKSAMAKEVTNAVMHTLFYLCHFNAPRQCIAVEHDIIPVLLKVRPSN